MNSIRNIKMKQLESHKIAILKNDASQRLNDLLNSESCLLIINQCREFRDRFYNPLMTIFLFIQQIFHPDKSCRNAVASHVTAQAVIGKKMSSSNTGPYCKARQRLPEATVKSLVKNVGIMVDHKAQKEWRWKGRNVKLVDGTTVSMADTKANQEKFPQHGMQEKGVGFPMVRIVVVISLAVGTIIDYAVDAYKGKGTGEHSLFRQIINCINPTDILMGDRYYPSFFLLSDLINRGGDGVFHGQAQRHYDFRKGESLGKKEHLVYWKKPQKPSWMGQETYDQHPKELKIREFKVQGKIYVTTLLDHKEHHKNELAKLYLFRWQVEISLGAIKTTLKMEHLSCKTPDMVLKEIGIHFLGYNIIRSIMAQSCHAHNKLPNQISFKGAIQLINQFMPYFLNVSENKKIELSVELLKRISLNGVGKRPGRVEPRAVKKRGKPFGMLKEDRKIAQNKLIAKIRKSRNSEIALA